MSRFVTPALKAQRLFFRGNSSQRDLFVNTQPSRGLCLTKECILLKLWLFFSQPGDHNSLFIFIFMYIFTTVKSCPILWCQLSSELAPPLEEEALLFDLLDVRKEKRLMRRREKLPDFLWLLAAEVTKLFPMLERSSWDWLKQDSFSRCFLRNSSLVPLCRNPTLWSLRLRVSRAPVEPVSDSTSSTEGRSEASEGVVSSGSAWCPAP